MKQPVAIVWTPARRELIATLLIEGLSAGQIAARIDAVVTRNAVMGIIYRDPKLRAIGLRGGHRSTASKRPKKVNPKPPKADKVVKRRRRAGQVPLVPMLPVVTKEAHAANCRRVALTQLANEDCRWPLGDPLSEAFRFCGDKKSAGRSYCPYHVNIAYQPLRR